MKREKEALAQRETIICLGLSRGNLVEKAVFAAVQSLYAIPSVPVRMLPPLTIDVVSRRGLLTMKSMPSSDVNIEAYNANAKQIKYRKGSNRSKHCTLPTFSPAQFLHLFDKAPVLVFLFVSVLFFL